MQDADKSDAKSGGLQAQIDGRDLRIGVVQARFNSALTDKLAESCLAELRALGVTAKHIKHVTVPDALVPLGCIVRGESYHFELVANESGAAVTRVSLDHQIPIANAILTVENEAQALARVEDKARDAARVAVEMATLMDDLL